MAPKNTSRVQSIPRLAQLCFYDWGSAGLGVGLLALVSVLGIHGKSRTGLQHSAQLAGFCLGVKLNPGLLQNPRLNALQEWA